MKQELTPEIEDALRFVKVTLGTGNVTNSGYLNPISCAMLLIELNRRNLFVISDPSQQPIADQRSKT